MTKITLELWGMTFMEPMALILNWALAGLSFLYYKRLRSASSWGFEKLWKAFFLTFAIAVFFEGLAHFLYFYIGKYGTAPGWTFALISVAFMEMAISTKLSVKWGTRLHYLIALKFIVLMALMSFDFVFKWVIIQSVSGFIVTLGGVSVLGLLKRRQYMKYFLLGIGVLLLCVPFIILEIDIHPWINRFDISLVFMFFSLILIYRGVRKSD
ncbi:MAG: hypothetical protein JXR07_07385 [Reichenbachiella sp.]